MFGHNLQFWFAIIGSGILRLVLSPWAGWIRSLASFATAVFIAVIFTDPTLAYLNLNPDTYKAAVAALLTLTGEGVARFGLGIVANPQKLVEWIRLWRGGGK